MTGSLAVERGTCYVTFTYDVASFIDLAACERLAAAEAHRQVLRPRRRGIDYFEYRPAPLRVMVNVPAVVVSTFTTNPSVEIVLYDFGAVAVTFAIPVSGPMESLIRVAEALLGGGPLLGEAMRHVESLLERLRPAISQLRISQIVEDYVIFRLEATVPPLDPKSLATEWGRECAQLLRAEPGQISEQEQRDALAMQIAFGASDLALLDWNAAILVGSDVDDLRAVIDFANVQLLELRELDRQLDDSLEESYRLVTHYRKGWFGAFRSQGAHERKVAQMQVDAAILFERVSNSLKIFGEEYLTRVYRLISARFRLAEWDAAIQRKLQTLNSIYGKLSDSSAAQRMEVLEWIIVVLIAVSILLPLIGIK